MDTSASVAVRIAALTVAAKVVPRKAGNRKVRLDMAGAALVVISCALLVLALNQGQENGWPLWTRRSITASLIGFGTTLPAAVEELVRQRDEHQREPEHPR